MTGPVHFIHLGGPTPILWQHYRAIKTARVHEAPIIFWAAFPTILTLADIEKVSETFPNGFEVREFDLPDWLASHPIQLANVKDLYAYRVLLEYGGIYLDLDTISLHPAWDLLPADKDLLVSTEYHPNDDHSIRNNSAVMIGRKGAPVIQSLAEEALDILRSGESVWGGIGPHLVSRYAESRLAAVIEQAPYRALNGWSYHSIGDYYANPRDPGEPTRVIHLYSSDHLGEFYADRWMPTT